jgi:hypothetical protein
MEIDTISTVSTTYTVEQVDDAIAIAMMRKALDTQAQAATDLLEQLPKSGNPNVGSNVDTFA